MQAIQYLSIFVMFEEYFVNALLIVSRGVVVECVCAERRRRHDDATRLSNAQDGSTSGTVFISFKNDFLIMIFVLFLFQKQELLHKAFAAPGLCRMV